MYVWRARFKDSASLQDNSLKRRTDRAGRDVGFLPGMRQNRDFCRFARRPRPLSTGLQPHVTLVVFGLGSGSGLIMYSSS